MVAYSVDPLAPAQVASELTKIGSEAKPTVEELMASRDSVAKEEVSSSKEKESTVVRAYVGPKVDSPPAMTSLSVASTTKACDGKSKGRKVRNRSNGERRNEESGSCVSG